MSDIIRSIECYRCGNSLWEKSWDTLKCTNCRYERPYHRRQVGTDITPSQVKAIEKIRKFFLRYGLDKELYRFDVKNVDGTVWVSVETSESVFVKFGAHIMVGRRGAIRVASVYDLVDDKKETAKFYANMLGGKLLDWAWEGK